jgi:type VI secretion system protein ImpJ
MRQLQPVLWSKGTLLTPQHLQIHDRFLESLLSFRLDALGYRSWGFSSLEIDRATLASGDFAIRSASGIFPDGLLFDIPSADQAPGPRPVVFGKDERQVDMHLAVPAYRAGARNVSGNSDGADVRFIAEAVLVRDETTGGSERSLLVARKNLRFLTSSEIRSGTPSIRIARIQKGQGEVLQLDPEFVPPLLRISASEFLISVLRRLVEILSAKSSELSGARRRRNLSLAEFSASDIANFWLLYTVNSSLPEIRHVFETQRGHPEHVFRVLSTLAGALTTFSSKVRPGDLPVYQHEDLGSCFKVLDGQIRMLLDTVVRGNTVSVPFRLTQPSMYSAALENEKYLRDAKLYLAVNADMAAADLIRKTPQLVKLCSTPNLNYLVKQSLPGIPLRFVREAASLIPVKLNYQYFSIDQHGALWDAVVRSRSIGAHVPGEFANAQLELLIVLQEPE